MAKHAAPQTVAVVPTGTTVIRPVALSAEDYLGRLRALATATPRSPGRHAR